VIALSDKSRDRVGTEMMLVMPFTFRKRVPVLPFLRLNLSKTGHSWTWHFFGWSYNTRSGQQSVDLPGPVNYQTKRRRRSAARD
jgi:hypothetical protein